MNAWSTASPSLQPISEKATASSTDVVAAKPITTMEECGPIERKKSINKTGSRPQISIISSTRLLPAARALFIFLLFNAQLRRRSTLAQWDYQVIAEQLQQQQQQFAANNGIVDDGYSDNVGGGGGGLDAAYTMDGGFNGYQQPQQRISTSWFNGGGAAPTNFGSSYGGGSGTASGVGNDGVDDDDTLLVRNGGGARYGMASVSGINAYQQPEFGGGYAPNNGDYGDASINNGWGGNGGGYGSGMYGGSNTPPFQPTRQTGFGGPTSNGGIWDEDGGTSADYNAGYGGGTFDNSLVNGYGNSNNGMMNNNNNAQQVFNGYGGGGGMMAGGNGVDGGVDFECFGGGVNGNAMMNANANNNACQMMMMGGGSVAGNFNGGGGGSGMINGGGGGRGSEFYPAPFMGNNNFPDREMNNAGQHQPMVIGHISGGSGHMPSAPAMMNSKMMMISSAASMPPSPHVVHSTHGVVNNVVDHHGSDDHNFGMSSFSSGGNGETGGMSSGYATMHRNGGEMMGMSSSSNNNNNDSGGSSSGHGSGNNSNSMRMPMIQNAGGSDYTVKRGSSDNPNDMTNNGMMPFMNGPNAANRKGGVGGGWMPPMNYGSSNDGGFYRSQFGMGYNAMDNDGGSAESYGSYGANIGGGGRGGGYSNFSGGGGATPTDLDYYDINDGMDGGGSSNMQGSGLDFGESLDGSFNPENMRRYAEYLELINKKYGIGIPSGSGGGSSNNNNNNNMGNGMNNNNDGLGMSMNMNNRKGGMMMTRPSSLLESGSNKPSGTGRVISTMSGMIGNNDTSPQITTTGVIMGNGESDGKEESDGTNTAPSTSDTLSAGSSRSSGGYGSYIDGETSSNGNTIVDGGGYYGTSEGGGDYGSQYLRPLNPPGDGNYVDAEVSPPRPQSQSVTSIQALTQQIRRLPAVFYLDSTNAASMQTEQLLRKTYSLPLVSFYVDKIDGGAEPIQRNLEELTAYKGMPYLFICGTFIGSQEHIDNYHNNKQIPQLVEYVCGENNNNKTPSNKMKRKKKQRPSRLPKQ